MTDEERKANARERMRQFRLRHADDPVYRARAREEKRRQLAKHSPERRKAAVNARAKRYREKHKDDPGFKGKAAVRTAAWREKNPERALLARVAWAAKNHEKVVEYYRQWRIDRSDYVARKSKEYAVSHAAELKAYRQANSDLMNARNAVTRARKNAAMPPWADKKVIKEFYIAAKQRTAETGVVWHVDHVVPLKHDLVCGLHVPANLQLLTATENTSKNNRFVIA